jgi:Ca-activated chloride channel family protein
MMRRVFGYALLWSVFVMAGQRHIQAQAASHTTAVMLADAAQPPSNASAAQPTAAAAPQTQPPSTQQPNDVEKQGGIFTLKTETSEVRISAQVLDGSGHTVQTLSKDAFHVYEDGVPQTILGFRHEDLPVSLGILIDSSGSMYDKRAAVDKASIDFVRLSNKEDEAFLVDFSFEPYIDQDFTNDVAKLQKGLDYVKSSGGTALYDTLLASADYLQKNAKHPKQVLLVITDGEDNASTATLEQAIRRIQDLDGPVIYTVGLLFGQDTDRRESKHARRVLESLSEQTGGVAYFPKSLKDVDSIAAQVSEDIRTQYSIAYRSTKPPELGGYRQIRVDAKEKGYGKLQVRTRTGYFPKLAGAKAPSATLSEPASKPQ